MQLWSELPLKLNYDYFKLTANIRTLKL